MPRLMLSETAVYEIRMHGSVRGGNREEPPYSISREHERRMSGSRLSPGQRVASIFMFLRGKSCEQTNSAAIRLLGHLIPLIGRQISAVARRSGIRL